MWLITNLNKTGDGSSFEFEPAPKAVNNSDQKFLINGHIINRQNGLRLDEASIFELYKKNGDNLPNLIKGNYTLIIVEKDSFKIISDRFAVKKYFCWQKGNDFCISDELSEIAKRVKLKPTSEGIINYSLFYHFAGGQTLFENTHHNQPGQILHFKNDKLTTHFYWNPVELLKQSVEKHSIGEIANSLDSALNSGLQYAKPDSISLSLTGGADTRNLLALFLKKNIRPKLYTYGNPASNDCVKASKIARGLNLNHEIHDIKMSAELFSHYARQIIKSGGGLASIHRAHRIMAVEKEATKAKWMFLGTLGGEFVKGVSEDDYIVPSIVYDNYTTSKYSVDHIRKYFDNKRINVSLIESAVDIVAHEPFMQGNIIERKLNALSYITAHLHDAQDINLYNGVMTDVFTPFLDIDYLEKLFASEFSFNNKEEKHNRYLKRLENPLYGSQFLKYTYPPLLKFRYSGDHIPGEVLFNKYYAGFVKIIRQKTGPVYPPNFPLGDWMIDYVKKELPLCFDYDILKEAYNLDLLMADFNQNNHKKNEAYWLKFTNPIMMRLLIEEFTNGK